MSHVATKWAFDQPEIFIDMKPNEWAVLMVLADCHNPINGCFPSHDYIVRKTNLSERSVRDQLARLRDRGLIAWDEMREVGRRCVNRYQLSFEPDFQPANLAGGDPAEPPANFAGGATGKSELSPPANRDASHRQNLPPNLVREPVTEPQRAHARVREEDFSHFWDLWDSHHRPDNRETAQKLFLKLTLSQAARAVAQAPTFFRLMAARKKPPRMIVYLKSKVFDDLDDGPEFDRDGDFIITPKRPEWSPWLGQIRNRHGEAGVQSYVRIGKILVKERWPDGHRPNVGVVS